VEKQEHEDQIRLKAKKGTWKRFFKLLLKCRLPWISLIAYIILELFFINMSVDETDLTAQLFAGDIGAALVTKLIGVMLLNLVLANIIVFTSQLTTAQMDRNMRLVLTEKIMRLPMSFFRDENPREAIYRIVHNSIVISSTVMLVILPIAFALYKSAAIFGRVFKYDWRLSTILLAVVPLQLFLAFLFGRINFSLSEREAHINSDLTHRLAEMITNIPLAKAFAKEEREAKDGNELIDRLYKVTIKGGWFDQFRDLSQTAVNLLQAAVLTAVGAALLADGGISTRNWVTFFMFSSTFSGAIYELTMYWNNLKVIQGGGDRVAEIMNAEEERWDGEDLERLSGDLEVSKVTFGYSEELPVLKEVSAVFPEGSRTALLGVSGCGKTTLLNLILQIYCPQSGRITVGGKDISSFKLRDYRKQFVMVSQDDMLFSGTIRENLIYGYDSVSSEALQDALARSGAAEFVNALPEGLETRLSEYGGNLSGGQKQRLSLARALISRAPFLVLDEPAAALDAIATEELIRTLKNASAGRTLIVIGHTPSILPLVERAVILENGKVSCQGDIATLRETSGFLRAFSGEEESL